MPVIAHNCSRYDIKHVLAGVTNEYTNPQIIARTSGETFINFKLREKVKVAKKITKNIR